MEMNDSVPLLDLHLQYRSIKQEILETLEKLLDSQRFVLGPEVESFEKEISEYCGVPHAVGVSSGTDALIISMMALGIGPGDEVITTPYTFFGTVGSIFRLGAKPIFVDIEETSFNLDPNLIEAAISPKTRAIIPVHLYGQCADMKSIPSLARQYQIKVIEDAAQSIGAEFEGKRAGAIGDMGCFSFYPAKNLGAFGDGGLVTVQDSETAERLKMLRDHGASEKYYHSMVGGNFRLDAIQAAILRIKLRLLDDWTKSRQENARDYNDRFMASGLVDKELVLPVVSANRHVFNQYVIRARDRNDLRTFLREKHIGCEIYYPLPLHMQKCFEHIGGKPGDFPRAEKAAKESLALPVFPELSEGQRARVVEVITDFYKSH